MKHLIGKKVLLNVPMSSTSKMIDNGYPSLISGIVADVDDNFITLNQTETETNFYSWSKVILSYLNKKNSIIVNKNWIAYIIEID